MDRISIELTVSEWKLALYHQVNRAETLFHRYELNIGNTHKILSNSHKALKTPNMQIQPRSEKKNTLIDPGVASLKFTFFKILHLPRQTLKHWDYSECSMI